jgi:hypothetical protein
MFPATCGYGHFSLFCYVELVPKVYPHLSVTLCKVGNNALQKLGWKVHSWIRIDGTGFSSLTIQLIQEEEEIRQFPKSNCANPEA